MPPDAPAGIAVIGAGDAAVALRRRLDAAGVRVHAADVGADGGAAPAAIATVVTSAVAIVTLLRSEPALRAVLDACTAARARDVVVLDLSPIAPAAQRDLAAAARASGVALVGGRILARVRDGGARTTLYVDDDATAAEPLRRVLAAIGDDVVTTGSGGRAKALGLVDDLLAGVNAAVVGEALALGRGAGLEARTLTALLQKGSGATVIMADADAAGVDAAARCAALAGVAAAAQQANHSLLFGSLAIGALQARPQAARGSAAAPGPCVPARAEAIR